MSKIKMKTRKAAAKRFNKSTAKGKIKRSQRNHGHFLVKMGHRKARKLQGTTYVSASDFNMIDSLVPFLRAKKKRTQALRRGLQASLGKEA